MPLAFSEIQSHFSPAQLEMLVQVSVPHSLMLFHPSDTLVLNSPQSNPIALKRFSIAMSPVPTAVLNASIPNCLAPFHISLALVLTLSQVLPAQVLILPQVLEPHSDTLSHKSLALSLVQSQASLRALPTSVPDSNAPIPPTPAPIKAPTAVPNPGITEPIAAPAPAPAPTIPILVPPENAMSCFSLPVIWVPSELVPRIALKISHPPEIRPAPPKIPPRIDAPPNAAVPPTVAEAPVPKVAPPASTKLPPTANKLLPNEDNNPPPAAAPPPLNNPPILPSNPAPALVLPNIPAISVIALIPKNTSDSDKSRSLSKVSSLSPNQEDFHQLVIFSPQVALGTYESIYLV